MQQVRTIELTEPQWEFFNNEAKFKAFISGIGAGKTAIGWILSIKEATQQPGSRGLIVAPTYTLIKDVIWWEMDQWLPKEVIKEFSENKKILRFKNGSEILFRSADNPRHIERLRGLSIAWFWIDECTLLPKLVWDILIGRLRQPGYNYKAWITGTPRGFNWVYEIFVEDPIPDSFILYNIPTKSNVFLSKEYIQSLEQQYKGQFALQELEGKFVKFEGLVYPGFDVGKHIVDSIPSKFDRVLYGVDWGFRNPACILALGVRGDEVYVLQEYYSPKTTDDELIEIAKQMQQKWGVGTFYCDPSEPASIEKFKRAGLNAVKANNEIVPGIKAVTALIESDRLFVHRSCQNLINEFQMYRYDDNDKETPLKINDHACFVAGTLITTNRGQVPIEQIKADDYVLTRHGFKKVIKSGLTQQNARVMELKLSDGRTLIGTPSHPIYVIGNGFIRMDALRYAYKITDVRDNKVVKSQKKLMKLFIKGSCSGDILNPEDGVIDGITDHMQDISTMELKHYIEKFGKIILERSLKDMLKKEYAQYVARNLELINTQKPKHVHVVAVESYPKKLDVYNLEVENAHEYYANGILVHNCDALRYAVMGLQERKRLRRVYGVVG